MIAERFVWGCVWNMSDCVSLYTNPMFSRCESLCGLVFFRLNYSAFGLAILLLGCSLYLSYYCDRRSMWWNGDEIRPWSIGSDTIVLVQSSPAPMGHVGNRKTTTICSWRGSFGVSSKAWREAKPNRNKRHKEMLARNVLYVHSLYMDVATQWWR